ncbi:arylsulfatase [Alienimonas chondri]|uniref:Sulfatase N-terminal domain-containing protein n=1 Tax=Alienimonas chondri TaxID=2681879 RepID=A0ABX1VAC4_9PLAN|nr:arylsulfatase [Alienimonas chondri]NNJ24866.1 hypothetical protein [Alienimonas chondri]
MKRPALALLLAFVVGPIADAAERPNVVLIITDDQGYGDLSCHGNTVLKTPHMDRLHGESVRLTDYHVDPTCSPTRAAIYAGRYSTRTGVWHTIQGRSLMNPAEVTIAERLREAGYRTGMIGKWHLGDNAPLRPRDQGFDDVFIHGGGGVGQAPDYWGNDYFGDTYFRFVRNAANPEGTEEKVQVDGYCTDEWFAAADRFVTDNNPAETGRPFFLTLATNAPHGPYLVAPEWSEPYREAGVKGPRADFYGMIACIDARLGEFRERLSELGLAENTILIFTTDNGTAAGHRDGGFNAGMRGNKGSEYDGGHRVPFFLHWPAGGFDEGRDVDRLTAHIDVLPTLTSLCGSPAADGPPLDGADLTPLLKDGEAEWPARTLAVHSQRIEVPEKWRKAAVMTERWRLVGGNELYDIVADPGQKRNVAEEHAEVAERLSAAYDDWWESLRPSFDEPMSDDLVRIELGEAATELCAHDWHEPENRPVPWSQSAIRNDPQSLGWWAVNVADPGVYRFTLRSRPAAADATPTGAMYAAVTLADPNGVLLTEPRRVKIGETWVELNAALAPREEPISAQSIDSQIDPNAAAAVLTVEIPQPGGKKLHANFQSKDGSVRGAYYVTVERLGDLPTR